MQVVKPSRCVIVAMSLMLLACEGQQATETLALSSPALVRVNQQPITALDLRVMREKLIARQPAGVPVSKEVDDTLLESLVRMVVIAQAGEALASADERAEIEIKTRRYREELLTELYLRKQTEPSIPSNQDVQMYYQTHLARFGQRDVHEFEWVRAVDKPKEQALQARLEALKSLDADHWSAQIARLKQNDHFEVIEANTAIVNLDAAVVKAVSALRDGEVSKVFFSDGRPQRVRRVKTYTEPARPLAEVRDTIRKTLAAEQVKQQLGDISEHLMQQADIVYATP